MTATTAARIGAKTEQALANLDAVKNKAGTLAHEDTRAEDWARYANEVARAEGQARVWARLRQTVDYFASKKMELTDAVLLDTIVELLAAGADDGWSGRTNDVQRSRFDGVREACTNAKYLVIAD